MTPEEKLKQELQKDINWVLERAAEEAESEPEFPGPMPENVRKLLLSLPLEEQQRRAVAITKRNIAKRIRSLKQ